MSNQNLEAAVKALLISRGAVLHANECWPETVEQYEAMCAKYPDYADSRSLVTDAFRDARAVLASISEQEVATLLVEGDVMRRLSANEVACYRWPEDTEQHRALRSAYMDGAAAMGAADTGWQPISTAPKDGTRILAWPVWSDGFPAEVCWREMKRTPGRWETGCGPIYGDGPTRWMPIPAAPEVQS